MKKIAVFLSLVLFGASATLLAQAPSTPDTPAAANSGAAVSATPAAPASDAQAAKTAKKAAKAAAKAEVRLKPFSEVALGGGFSLMGVNLQAATNVDRYLNLRATGNIFKYTANNININGSNAGGGGSTNGVDVSGDVNFATLGLSLDYYPFPKHGLRLSPGLLLYNDNEISATGALAAGNSITLSGTKYYSASANAGSGATPLNMAANLGLNSTKPAFTLTTGWGNMIPRKNGKTVWSRLSFPVEIGAAFTGAPSLNVNLTGWACLDQAQTQCSDISGDSEIATQVQSNLTTQVAKWKSDVNALQVYPIFSFGVAYDFHIK